MSSRQMIGNIATPQIFLGFLKSNAIFVVNERGEDRTFNPLSDVQH